MKQYIFIKLGGSLITEKDTPETARPAIIQQLAKQIKEVIHQLPDTQFVLGNGAGSFGHYKVVEHQLKEGITRPDQIFGYADVHDSAARLNRIVVHELLQQGIPAASLQPSALFTAHNGKKNTEHYDSFFGMIQTGIVPVVYGDVIIDTSRGCVIFSTETIFDHLIEASLQNGAQVSAVIHVGQVAGVLDSANNVIPLITKETWPSVQSTIYAPKGYDITGGMKHKIESSLQLTEKGIETYLVSGESENILVDCLVKRSFTGTQIR